MVYRRQYRTREDDRDDRHQHRHQIAPPGEGQHHHRKDRRDDSPGDHRRVSPNAHRGTLAWRADQNLVTGMRHCGTKHMRTGRPPMEVTATAWIITVGVIVALLAIDLAVG